MEGNIDFSFDYFLMEALFRSTQIGVTSASGNSCKYKYESHFLDVTKLKNWIKRHVPEAKDSKCQ